jgi:ABC-type multidrug transport system permease subunit
MIKYVQVVTHAILNIMLFHNLGYDSKGIEDRRGLILRLLITVLGISTYSTAIMLTLERKVIMKELSENLYSLNSYLIMKFLGEIPTIIVTCTILVFASYYPADLNQSSGWNVWILFLAVIDSNLQAFIFGCSRQRYQNIPLQLLLMQML